MPGSKRAKAAYWIFTVLFSWSWSVGYLVLGALSYLSFRMTAPS